MSDAFNQAAEKVKNLKAKPTDQEMLDIYGLFKQATVGNVNIDRPGMMAFTAKAKWDAWNANKGMSKEDAESRYVSLADKLVETYGLN